MYDSPKGIIVINGNIYSAEAVLKAVQVEGLVDIRQSGESLVIGNRKIEPVRTSVEKEASAITCYGSLSYCCGLAKPCVERDLALKLLGLTKKEYRRLKNEFHEHIIKAAKEKIGSEETDLDWTSATQLDTEEIIDVERKAKKEDDMDFSSLFPEPSEPHMEEPEFNFDILENSNIEDSPHGTRNRRTSIDDYCAICGAKVGNEAQYCPECGERLNTQREIGIQNKEAF
ncbi:MAG: zinc ribbon domain-containing protein [Promethearchaeota archaeon]